MKKVLAVLVVKLFLLAPLLILEGESFYVGAQGGLNFLNCHFLKKNHCGFTEGYNIGAVGGYVWTNGLRIEAEITYRDNNYRLHGVNEDSEETTFHGHVNTWSGMGNGYYEFPICISESITPYFGAGIGFDRVHQAIKMERNHFKGHNTGFAWQLMGGVNLCLFENTLISLEYKFHMSPLRRGHQLQNQSITLGIQRRFLLF